MSSSPRRRFVAAVALALLGGLAAVTVSTAAHGKHTARKVTGPGTACGGRLWRLMTLSDAANRTVQLTGTPTTMPKIALQRTPERISTGRTTRFQRHAWRLHTIVDRYRIATNGEIVLVLFNIESGQYMNAYFPNPLCLGRKARDRTGMIAARRELTSHCPAVTPAWQLLGITVDLSGIGFWNPSRVTRGAMPNGAELRPLTNFKIVSGCGI
jgi:hypothetical protein